MGPLTTWKEASEMQAHQASGNVQPRLATVLSNIGGPLAVAVSGGVDSVTLATFAHRADGPLSRTAILGQPHRTLLTAPVAIVMAGTSDLPVRREAARTLAFAGQRYREYTDVGVAGFWRLLERIGDIRSSPVVIVAAGMDAALVNVVGGLVSSAVIALPTSVGYGVALGGATALHAALASCAPGISVVNIDNGYGAACAALRISLALAASQNAAEHPE